MKSRPFGVTVLALLAGLAAVLAAVHALQALGIFPFMSPVFAASRNDSTVPTMMK